MEEDVGCTRKYEKLRFQSLHEVINVVREECLEHGKIVHKEGLGSYLERGMGCLDDALNETANNNTLQKKQVLVRAHILLAQAP